MACCHSQQLGKVKNLACDACYGIQRKSAAACRQDPITVAIYQFVSPKFEPSQIPVASDVAVAIVVDGKLAQNVLALPQTNSEARNLKSCR